MVSHVAQVAAAGCLGEVVGYSVGVLLNMNPIAMAHFFGVNTLTNQATKFLRLERGESRLMTSVKYTCANLAIGTVLVISGVAFEILNVQLAVCLFALIATRTFCSVLPMFSHTSHSSHSPHASERKTRPHR